MSKAKPREAAFPWGRVISACILLIGLEICALICAWLWGDGHNLLQKIGNCWWLFTSVLGAATLLARPILGRAGWAQVKKRWHSLTPVAKPEMCMESRELELPVVDVISSGFRIERDSTGAVARIIFIAGLYVKPRSEQEIVFPRHDCTVHITAPGSFPRTPFKTIWLMEGDDRHKSGAVPNEIVVDRPKAVDLWAFIGPLPLVDGQKAEVSISLLPVNARTPIVIRHEIIFPTAPGPAKRANP